MERLTVLMGVVALLLSGAACALGMSFWRRESQKERDVRRLRGLEDRVRCLEQQQTRLWERLGALENGRSYSKLFPDFTDQVDKLLRYQAGGKQERDASGV